MNEAEMKKSARGLEPAGEGWFAVNVRDAAWIQNENFGAACIFEGEDRFPQIGYTLQVLQPGQPNGLYHRESDQEDFLVLSGECLLLVEGEERRLQAWDFVHCPAQTEHIFLGAGDGPCVIFMAGSRTADRETTYPTAELATRHGAGSAEATSDSNRAYAPFAKWEDGPPSFAGLPWQPR
jgi:uncharacterized cupin superfamily protein